MSAADSRLVRLVRLALACLGVGAVACSSAAVVGLDVPPAVTPDGGFDTADTPPADQPSPADAPSPTDLPSAGDLGVVPCGALGQPCCAADGCVTGLLCGAGSCQMPGPGCGHADEPCCVGGTCDQPALCAAGRCQAPTVPCGSRNMPCCPGNHCADGLVCPGRICQTLSAACGRAGQPCCENDACGGTLVCLGARCAVAPTTNCGAMGGPCCPSDLCLGSLECTAGRCGAPVRACGVVGAPCCAGVCGRGAVCVSGQCRGVGCGLEGNPCCVDAGCAAGLGCVLGLCTPGALSCGNTDQPACAMLGTACAAPLVLVGGMCRAPPRCGSRGQVCCDGRCLAPYGCVATGFCLPVVDNVVCGALEVNCCAGNTCLAGYACVNSACVTATCGDVGLPCCNSGGADCLSGRRCNDGMCEPLPPDCGRIGQACCDGNVCRPRAYCIDGRCY